MTKRKIQTRKRERERKKVWKMFVTLHLFLGITRQFFDQESREGGYAGRLVLCVRITLFLSIKRK